MHPAWIVAFKISFLPSSLLSTTSALCTLPVCFSQKHPANRPYKINLISTLAAKEHRSTYPDSTNIATTQASEFHIFLWFFNPSIRVSNMRGISQPSSIPILEIRETSSPSARLRLEDHQHCCSKPMPPLLWPSSSSSILLRDPTASFLDDQSSSFALCLCLFFFISFQPVDLASRRSTFISHPHRPLQTSALSSATVDHEWPSLFSSLSSDNRPVAPVTIDVCCVIIYTSTWIQQESANNHQQLSSDLCIHSCINRDPWPSPSLRLFSTSAFVCISCISLLLRILCTDPLTPSNQFLTKNVNILTASTIKI